MQIHYYNNVSGERLTQKLAPAFIKAAKASPLTCVVHPLFCGQYFEDKCPPAIEPLLFAPILTQEKFSSHVAKLGTALKSASCLAVFTPNEMQSQTESWLDSLSLQVQILFINTLPLYPAPLTRQLVSLQSRWHIDTQEQEATRSSMEALGKLLRESGIEEIKIIGEQAFTVKTLCQQAKAPKREGCIPILARQLSPFVTTYIEEDLIFPGFNHVYSPWDTGVRTHI